MNSRELVTLDKLLSQTAQQPDTVEKIVAQALTSPFVQMVNLLQNISIYDRSKQNMPHVDFTVTLALEG